MMKPYLFLVLWALAAMLPTGASGQAPPAATAQPPAALTAAQAQQALEVLQDPQKREQLIAVLKAIAATAPAMALTPAPAAEAPTTPPITLKPHSLGAQLLVTLSRWGTRLAKETATTARAMTNLPALWSWLVTLATDPAAAASFLIAIGWLVLVIACALALEFLCGWALRRPRDALTRHLPRGNGDNLRLLSLVPYAFVGLALDLVPVAVFAAAGTLLVGTIGAMREETPLVVLAVVDAYAVCRAIMCAARMLVSPDDRRLRLWRLSDNQARFVIVSLQRIVVIAVFGDALVEVALLLGLDQSAHDGLDRLITLVLAVLLIIVVIRSRREIASYIRAPRAAGSGATRWRGWFAEAWTYLAVIAIATGWIGVTTSDGSGLAALYFPGVTLAAVIGARLLTIIVLGSLDRLLRLDPKTDKLPGLNPRIARYRRPLEVFAVAIIATLSAVVLLQLWGAAAFTWFAQGSVGHRLVSALTTVAIAVVVAILIWEVSQAVLERQLGRLGDDLNQSRSARLLTLLPMLRTALLTTILTVVGLTALSEIGVNITPLLAGASIAGIAIGFGSQRLVQDVITGMFVLFENAIQIGDGVTVAGLSGNVEALSVRTIRLRAGDGAVHIIPFSAVSSITNNNRGLGNAAISVTVAYEEDTDRVATVLTKIAAEMRDDPDFSRRMLGELQLFGVDALHPWGVTIAGQIACSDTGRLPVQREFNRRLKKRFEELEIALGGPPGGD